MTLDEFRQENPAYNDMSDAALADALYKNFYANDMTRTDFMQSIAPSKPLPSFGEGVAGLFSGDEDIRSKRLVPNAPSFFGAVKSMIYDPLVAGSQLAEQAGRGVPFDTNDPAVAGKVLEATAFPTAASTFVKALPTAAARETAGQLGAGGGRMRPAPDQLLADRPAKIINKVVAKDSTTPDLMEQQGLAAARSGADTVSPLDLGNKNVEKLAGTLYRSGGDASRIIEEHFNSRAEGQADRLTQGVGRNLGDPNSAYRTADELFEARRAESKPLYDAAYAHPLDTNDDRFALITHLVENTPAGQAAMAKARTILENEARPGQGFTGANAGLIAKDEDGKWVFTKLPTTRELDTVLRGMDDVIDANKVDAGLGREPKLTQLGGSVQGVKNDVRAALFALNPKFQEARAQYASKSELRDAIQLGIKAWDKPADQIARDVAGMTPSEAEHYRIGAATALRDRINKRDGFDVDRTQGLLSPEFKRKLAAVFPDDAQMRPQGDGLGNFTRQLESERLQATKKNRIARGSQTTERAGDDARALIEGIELARQVAKNPIGGGVQAGLDWIIKYKMGINDPKVAADVARLLTQRADDPAAFKAMFERLRKQTKREK